MCSFISVFGNFADFPQQIQHWLKYHHNKTNLVSSKVSGNSFLATLVAKLISCNVKKLHKLTAYNFWTKHEIVKEKIQRELDSTVCRDKIPRSNHAKVQGEITRCFFNQLPKDHQKEWVNWVEVEHKQACDKHEEHLNSGPSTTPKDWQRWVSLSISFSHWSTG